MQSSWNFFRAALVMLYVCLRKCKSSAMPHATAHCLQFYQFSTCTAEADSHKFFTHHKEHYIHQCKSSVCKWKTSCRVSSRLAWCNRRRCRSLFFPQIFFYPLCLRHYRQTSSGASTVGTRKRKSRKTRIVSSTATCRRVWNWNWILRTLPRALHGSSWSERWFSNRLREREENLRKKSLSFAPLKIVRSSQFGNCFNERFQTQAIAPSSNRYFNCKFALQFSKCLRISNWFVIPEQKKRLNRLIFWEVQLANKRLWK